jgi:dipeptidyl aminopeptidase/acylaminoacyl peptidase
MTRLNRLVAVIAAAACVVGAGAAQAQQEFPPPQGKGRVVVLASGLKGPGQIAPEARALAQQGYDVVLFDGNPMEGNAGSKLKADILQAQQMPHALPGKVALVGFSLGGGMALYYGGQLPDLVAGAVVWFPATVFIKNVPGFADKLSIPVLMFAGESDTFRGCCLIDHARDIAAATAAAGKPLELVTYPDTNHDFIPQGDNYNPTSYADAWQRTLDRLKQYLGS